MDIVRTFAHLLLKITSVFILFFYCFVVFIVSFACAIPFFGVLCITFNFIGFICSGFNIRNIMIIALYIFCTLSVTSFMYSCFVSGTREYNCDIAIYVAVFQIFLSMINSFCFVALSYMVSFCFDPNNTEQEEW